MGDNNFNPIAYAETLNAETKAPETTPDVQDRPVPDTEVAAADQATPSAPAEGQPAQTNERPQVPNRGQDIYAERRARAIKASVLVAVLAGWVYFNGIPGAAPSQEEQRAAGQNVAGDNSRNATADTITAQVNNDLAAADAHYKTHGKLDNIELRGGNVRWAAAGGTLVASRLIDTTCFMYGWVDNEKQAAVIDDSGQACTDEAIAVAQADLNEQAAGIADALEDSADDSFAAAATGARQYAMSNWVGGEASLLNIPTDLGHGVTVVDNQGHYVVAQATNGNDCQEVSIGADGSVGEPQPCS